MLSINNVMTKKLLVVTMLVWSPLSSAALFDDTEARKKIVEIQQKMKVDHQETQSALAALKKSQQDLEQRVVAIEAVVKGQGLADMQNQIELLNQEVAKLKGALEEAQHSVEVAQQRQKDLYTDTDTRLRKLEAAPVAAPAAQPVTPAVVTPPAEEKDIKAFADADGLSKAGKHKEAFAAFDTFLKDYPNSKLAPDAMYGLGYSQFALKNYKSSIATQQKLMDSHPDHAKVPDAMYSMANSQIQLGQVSGAKKTLRALVDKYPNAEVTASAQKRLKTLEALK